MGYGYNQLLDLLKNNILEISFARRNKRRGKGEIRGMICTNSTVILQSTEGQTILNYRPPFFWPIISPEKYQVIITWDVLMQDYRMIPIESITVLNIIPQAKYVEYIYGQLILMSGTEKMDFMYNNKPMVLRDWQNILGKEEKPATEDTDDVSEIKKPKAEFELNDIETDIDDVSEDDMDNPDFMKL